MTGGSFGGGAGAGGGSTGGTSPTATTFGDIKLNDQNQANALIDPADTPAVDTFRVVEDGTNVVLYFYSVALGTWVGVQAS